MNIYNQIQQNLKENEDTLNLVKNLKQGTKVRIYNKRGTGNANWNEYSYMGSRYDKFRKEPTYVFWDDERNQYDYSESDLLSMPKNSIKIPKYNVRQRINYNDAVDLICSSCGTKTRFYNAYIKPDGDFYNVDFKNKDDEKCPVCGNTDLNLDMFHFGMKSSEGESYDILERGNNNVTY